MNKSPMPFPDEVYLRQRDVIAKKTETRSGLVASMNRYFGDGVQNFSKSDLGIFGHQNWPYIEELLLQWESDGWLRVTKPMEEAAPSDVVVEMVKYLYASPVTNAVTKSA